ncbi:uncharacterized protein TNCV_2181111 [Trichonephila clavipes]|uniref:Uncharacterized protein n=1 Tax=Trichonephila clavipes TaxID=2585209 RepID=A0A8X6VUU9_TRICX|nr:uncharacterized protein TNCV_2181111 [Trichonephila clavipes]
MNFSRGRIIGRLECGRTHLEVPEELGITQSVISRLWQQFQNDGNGTLVYMLVGLSDVFHSPQLIAACDEPLVESMHCGHRNSRLV